MSSDILIRPRVSRLFCRVSALLTVAVYFGVRLLLDGGSLQGPLRIFVALLPVPFFVFLFVVQVRYLRGVDEMQQRIQLEALAIAFPAILLLLLTLGLLQVAGVAIPQEDWSYRHIWIIALALYAVGVAFAKRRYQ